MKNNWKLGDLPMFKGIEYIESPFQYDGVYYVSVFHQGKDIWIRSLIDELEGDSDLGIKWRELYLFTKSTKKNLKHLWDGTKSLRDLIECKTSEVYLVIDSGFIDAYFPMNINTFDKRYLPEDSSFLANKINYRI